MSVPFRERNPVVIGAVSLAVIAAFILAAFKAEDLPLIGGGDTYYAAFSEAGGLKANDEVRIAGVRVGKVADGRAATATTCGSPSRSTTGADFGTRHRRRDQGQDAARRDVPRLEPAGRGQLEEGRRDPGRSGPRRRTTSSRRSPASPSAPSRSTPTSWPVAEHAGRPDPEHPRGVPRRAGGLSRTCRATSPRATSSSTRCCATPRRCPGCSATASGDIVVLMQRRRRAASARWSPAARRCTTCSSRPASCRSQLTGLVRDTPGRPQAGAGPPRQRGRRAQQEPGQPRQQPAADGAVLPGVRQHPRQRPWFDTYIQNLPPVPDLRLGG